MIPAHWFRRFVLAVFILEVAGGVLWVSARLAPDPDHRPLAQTVASLIFLAGVYASGPLAARFLVPVASSDLSLRERLTKIAATLPSAPPINLYDHPAKEANTVGLLPRHARVYVTAGLLTGMSDEGVRGVLAHELVHVQEWHILAILLYACCFVLGSHFLDNRLFLVGFLLFLMLRRYTEYRADAGAARIVGTATMLTALRELAVLYPSRPWHRWVSFLTAYPTLFMRMRALEAGRRPLL